MFNKNTYWEGPLVCPDKTDQLYNGAAEVARGVTLQAEA